MDAAPTIHQALGLQANQVPAKAAETSQPPDPAPKPKRRKTGKNKEETGTGTGENERVETAQQPIDKAKCLAKATCLRGFL